MNYSETDFSAGNLVRARNREWVVQPGSEPSTLKLRPLGGSDEDIVTLIPGLELEPVTSATFSLPDPALAGSHDAAMLLRTRHTAAQSALTRAERLQNVQGAFAVEPLRAHELRGRRVVLVDDVMTTGASLRAAASALRLAGAAHITALVFARTG